MQAAGHVEVLLFARHDTDDLALVVVHLVRCEREGCLGVGTREQDHATLFRKHRQGLVVRLFAAKGTDDGLRAATLGELLDARHRVFLRGVDELIGAHFPRLRQPARVQLADDHPSAAILERDHVHQAHHAGSQHHDVLSDVRVEDAGRVNRTAQRLGDRSDLDRCVADLVDAVRRVCLEVREATRPPCIAVPRRTGIVAGAGAVLARHAPMAAAARRRADRNQVPDLEARRTVGADGGYLARHLMTADEGEGVCLLAAVGPLFPRADGDGTDPYEHVTRTRLGRRDGHKLDPAGRRHRAHAHLFGHASRIPHLLASRV